MHCAVGDKTGAGNTSGDERIGKLNHVVLRFTSENESVLEQPTDCKSVNTFANP